MQTICFSLAGQVQWSTLHCFVGPNFYASWQHYHCVLKTIQINDIHPLNRHWCYDIWTSHYLPLQKQQHHQQQQQQKKTWDVFAPILAWSRHIMEMLSELLALCKGNPLLTGGFLPERAINAVLNIFFDVNLHKLLNKPSVIWDAWC